MHGESPIKRRESRKIWVGNVPVGGDAPIAVQSMTNSDTNDVAATVAQINRLEAAGVDIVRVSVPDMDAAEAFGKIKQLVKVPLVADIHFDYRIALRVAELGVDCLRINPGNIGREDRVRAVVDASRTPVIVATGQVVEREAIVSATELAVRAARQALDAAGGVAGRVQRVTMLSTLFSAASATVASEVASALGLHDAYRETTSVGGNTPPWLVTRAAEAAGPVSGPSSASTFWRSRVAPSRSKTARAARRSRSAAVWSPSAAIASA